jgi:hypothetical protein
MSGPFRRVEHLLSINRIRRRGKFDAMRPYWKVTPPPAHQSPSS